MIVSRAGSALSAIVSFVVLVGAAHPAGPAAAAGASECGQASWYEFESRTASGEMADPEAPTAAHPSLPFGTWVLVENLGNDRSVEVRVIDRGPHSGGRIIDVSRAAAQQLGLIEAGVGKVRVTMKGAEATGSCR